MATPTPNTAGILDWFKESVQRLKQDSPAFFNVLNKVHYVIIFIAAFPNVINEFIALGIVPENWNTLVPGKVLLWITRIVGIAAAYGAFVAKLPVTRTPVEVQPQGLILNVTEPSKLPFTAQKEAAMLEKQEAALLEKQTNEKDI